ncbi:MAG: DUF5916 domain-containing protein [Pseudomonadota bacterium]|nr:DUF5916 domain-containing protein [Pseudomonadota bacterium]
MTWIAERNNLQARILLALLLVLTNPLFSQDTTESFKLQFNDREIINVQKKDVSVKIKIDGKIDDAEWQDVTFYDPYMVTKPDTLAKPSYKSKLRFFYTANGFYISMDMEQPKNTLVKRFKPRDDWQTKSDKTGFSIDTSGDGKYGYWFSVSLGDSEGDGTLMPEKIYSSDWDGAWYGATSETENGWSAEFYLPWSQVAMPKDADDRIINLYSFREVAHLNEEWGWPALPESLPQFISLFQPTRMNNVNLKQQWSVFPYASVSYDRIDKKTSQQGGVDFFWRPSTNAQITATVNPDFGAVESDNVVVNLSANETFFPEKRLFFQEGNEVFVATPRASNQGWSGRSKVTIINTRRIGSTPELPTLPDGVSFSKRTKKTTKADLTGAIKTTGQINKLRYGILAATEEDTDFKADDNKIYNQVGRDFGAFRLLYEDTDQGDTKGLGFLSTIVTKPDTDSVVHAADFHYLSESGVWKADGQYIHTNTQEYGSGKGGFFDIVHAPRQGRRNQLKLTVFDENMEINDFGFNQRKNTRDIQYNFTAINSNSKRFRDTNITGYLRYAENFDGHRTSNAIGGNLDLTLNNLNKIKGSFAHWPVRFEDRESYGNGTFKLRPRSRLRFEYSTNKAEKIAYGATVTYQEEDMKGRKLEGELEYTWYPKTNISFDMKLKYVDGSGGWLLHQQDKDFTSFYHQKWEQEFKFNYFINAKQQLSINLQWVGIQAHENKFYVIDADNYRLNEINKPYEASDNFSISDLNIQLRYRWQIAPLSDIYLVATKTGAHTKQLTAFNDMLEDTMDTPLSDQIILKIRYRFGS